jgi:hypothetical protein
MLRAGGRWYRDLRCRGGVHYAQFTRAEDQPGEPTVAEWGAALLDRLTSDPPRLLLLDLRFNTGGNLGTAHPLVQALAASPLGRATGRIVVLSGVSTFSAGITPLAYLRGHSGAIVVGRPPGDEADFWAEGGNVVLPYSGTILHYADGLHAYSDRPLPPGVREFLELGIDVPHLRPDRLVRWTWDDYRSGRDPDAEAATGAPLHCPG